MRYLRLAVLPLLVVACEQQPAAPDLELGPELRASDGWGEYYIEFAAGEFIFPTACIDEEFQFTGKMWFRQQFVAPTGAAHGGESQNHFKIWYEGEFRSLTTGNRWDLTHMTNRGVFWGASAFDNVAMHEYIWLEEEGIGRRIQTSYRQHFVRNASGDYKVQMAEFTCYVR